MKQVWAWVVLVRRRIKFNGCRFGGKRPNMCSPNRKQDCRWRIKWSIGFIKLWRPNHCCKVVFLVWTHVKWNCFNLRYVSNCRRDRIARATKTGSGMPFYLKHYSVDIAPEFSSPLYIIFSTLSLDLQYKYLLSFLVFLGAWKICEIRKRPSPQLSTGCISFPKPVGRGDLDCMYKEA